MLRKVDKLVAVEVLPELADWHAARDRRHRDDLQRRVNSRCISGRVRVLRLAALER
jgi:hypothetical protein